MKSLKMFFLLTVMLSVTLNADAAGCRNPKKSPRGCFVFNPSPVLPQVGSASLLLSLQAGDLSLSDGTPVGLWPDTSGQGHDFIQSGAARPTFLSNKDGYPAVEFDGLNVLQWMTGPTFADNLSNFAVFSVAAVPEIHNDYTILTKLDNSSIYPGWWVGVGGAFKQNDTSVLMTFNNNQYPEPGIFKVRTAEFLGSDVLNVYDNGDSSTQVHWSTNPVVDFSNSEPVRLGIDGQGVSNFDGLSGDIRAVMLYQITNVSTWPTDRAAITAWLAAKYGITLP